MVATRKLEIQITGDTTGASRAFGSVDDAAGRTESRMSSWSTKVAGLIGAAFAVDTIIDWGSTLISAAEESEQVTAQTTAVLASMGDVAGVTADEVAELAEQISLKTGLDDEMIQSGENVLLTFGNIRNEVGEGNDVFTRATEVATDMSVALGQDLQSSITQVGKALNDPIAGLSALSRVGVQFTDEQKNMITMMVVAGDTMGAQKVILQELERQFGGSAEAQATASDKLRTAWGNVQEQLGAVLLPIFEKVATWLAETLPGAIDTATTWVKDHETTVKNLAFAFGVILVGALVAYTVQAGIAAAATLAATWPILLALVAVGALAFGLYYAYQNWGWFRVGVQNAIEILGRIIGIIQSVIGWVDRLSDKLALVGGLFGGLGGISNVGDFFGGGGKKGTGYSDKWPGMATGGIVTKPTLTWVGEEGPEAVVPLSQYNGGGGGDTYITVKVDGSVLTDGRRLIDLLNDELGNGYRLQDRGRGL